MTNSTANNQSQGITLEESIETGFSIQEIKSIYSKLNQNLIEVMERMDDILLIGSFDENDIKFIKKRDCKFLTLEMKEQDVNEYGTALMSNIFQATLTDALHKFFVFFNGINFIDWYENLHEYRTAILKMDGDSTYLLKVINDLYDSLNNIHNGFNSEYLDEIDEVYDGDVIDFDADFMELCSKLNAVTDLFEKNKILHQAIAEKDMFCLMIGVEPKKYGPNLYFKEKCKTAIEIIKLQIENTLEDNTTNKSVNKTSVLEERNPTNEFEAQIKNPEFTTRRQVLALFYLLDAIDKGINSIDRTVKARFIHFLTGKNESNIYKTLSEPHKGLENEKNKRSAIKDLEFIKKHFDELGLKSISQKITNDMANS